ncbi:MAG: hypothetical protein Unbinned6316contig1000_42 [Prokaryotic dsDNA virus sp.]|nr:MAG: hypothetical protein Unbinned6316contig1000_42 [Prokaryotic dsDNA virus sp.]|tara:strand:- start:10161 stop:10658 length:498 start_codon:yes stop_codon:yes gene_type:complete
MIQAITGTDLETYVQTKDNRVNLAVATSNIRHLWKFTNDMNKAVTYVYAKTETITDRYTKFEFDYRGAVPAPISNLYNGIINFLPAGFWKYEVFEVSWVGTVAIEVGRAPVNETTPLEPASDDKGIVQGLVTKGKMYVAEKDGTEQVQYTQHPEPSGTNYIYYGQ